MLSVIGVNETTRTATSSAGRAHMVATTAAAPAMSHFISIIDSAGLIDSPPESNVMPLPTSATRVDRVGLGQLVLDRLVDRRGGVVGQLQQARRLHRALVDRDHAAETGSRRSPS